MRPRDWCKVLMASLSLLAVVCCSDTDDDWAPQSSDNENALYRSMFSMLTKSGRFSELIDLATPIFYRMGDDTLSEIAAEACAYIAQSYIYLDKYDSIVYYMDCLDRFRTLKAGDIKWNYTVNNVSALWSIKIKGDYDNALLFYLKSLEEVDSAGDYRTKCVVLSNIVSLYRSMKNPDGLPYAEMVYKTGHEIGEDYYKSVGAYSMSSMLYFCGDFESAKEYAQEAIAIAGKNGMGYLLAESYLVYGDICVRLFDYESAEKYYGLAGRYSLNESSGIYTKVCLAYGKMYNVRKMYADALRYIDAGLARSGIEGEMECYPALLKEKSVSYSRLGEPDSAAFYYRLYHKYGNNEKFMANEQKFDIVMMQYYQEEIDRRNAKLEKVRLNYTILILIALLVCVAAVSIYYFYHSRIKTYSVLVNQYRRIVGEGGSGTDGNFTEKEKNLWEKVEALMRNEKLYRHKDVSLAKISEILNTNRTYVSRVINKFSGLSFYDYINRYRIKDAVAVLSEDNDSIPLKVLYDDLGFNSNSVFYRAFLKETGVPPSYFRDEVRKKSRREKGNMEDCFE